MKFMIVTLVCALAFVSVQAHTDEAHSDGNAPAKKTTQSKKVWSCPMHPDVKSKSKGKCPKCKMDLRPVVESEAAVTSHEADTRTAEMTKVSGSEPREMNIPDVELLDQDWRKIHFYTDLVKGRTVVINFIFATCTTICGLTRCISRI